jgi:hypothetical protein
VYINWHFQEKDTYIYRYVYPYIYASIRVFLRRGLAPKSRPTHGHGVQYGIIVTLADWSYLDPRTRRESSESTSSLAEKGRASAAVQHSSRGSQRLGMAAFRVTMVALSQETA